MRTIIECGTKEFWDWFILNNEKYLNIDNCNSKQREDLLNELLQELHKYCSHLFFEFSVDSSSRQGELIITADGNSDYFEKANLLVKEAPLFESWKIISLIPNRGIPYTLEFEGRTLNPKKIWFLPLLNTKIPEAIGVRIGIEEYDPDDKWLLPAINKMIDNIVGEKFAAEIIKQIQVYSMESGFGI